MEHFYFSACFWSMWCYLFVCLSWTFLLGKDALIILHVRYSILLHYRAVPTTRIFELLNSEKSRAVLKYSMHCNVLTVWLLFGYTNFIILFWNSRNIFRFWTSIQVLLEEKINKLFGWYSPTPRGRLVISIRNYY